MSRPPMLPEVEANAHVELGRPLTRGDWVYVDEESGRFEWWPVELAAGAARHVLTDAGEGGPDAEVALLRAVEAAMLRAEVPEVPPADGPSGRERDGMHERDASAVAFLRTLGAEGGAAADQWAAEARERWARVSGAQGALDPAWLQAWDEWRDLPKWQRRFSRTLASALWHGQVRAGVEKARREAQRSINVPALTAAVHDRILSAHVPGLRIEELDGQRVLFDRNGAAVVPLERVEPLDVPSLELDTARALLPQGALRLGSVRAHRLLRWEVVTGHRQRLENNPDARVIRVEGGWQALPEAIGLAPSGAAVEELRQIVVAQAHLCWRWPDGTTGNMLSYQVRSAVGRRRGMLSIVLGDPLMPHFLFAMHGESARNREARRLVPMVDLPPFVGDRRSHGAQASLQMAIVGELRNRAVEIVEHGGVRLTEQDWLRFSAEVGLASGLVARVVDRWTQDGDDGPAFLARVNGDPARFTLGPSHAAALALLRDGGRREQKGAEAGRRAADGRQRARWGRRRGKQAGPK